MEILDWEAWAERERWLNLDMRRSRYGDSERWWQHGKDPIYGQASRANDGIQRECTLRELAEEMGVCLDRVRQLEVRALRKLRENPKTLELFRDMIGELYG